MSRFKKILRIVTAVLAGLFLLVVVSGIIIVQTQWFRDFVRTKIVTAVETATGGKTDIGSFTFDWRHLRAQIRNFNIHGLEPAGSQPLFHANLVQVDLKLLSPFKGFVDIAYLLLDTPQANVIVYPDGHTNIPAPNVPAKSSNKTGLETIVDLAIGHFDLRNGSFAFGNQQSHLDASGANFRAQLGYNALDPSYTGQIDISPLHLRNAANAPLDVDIQVPVTAHKDQVQIANAQFSTQHSHIVISGTVDHLIAPRTNAHINAQIALEDVRNAAALKIPLDLVHGPRTLSADITAAMDQQSTRIQSARITLGNTNIEASGDLKEANGGKGATFNATLDLTQLGTLLEVAARPQGTVKLGGSARMDAQNNYAATGNIEAHQLAFRSGTTRVSNVNFDSGVAVDPHRIALSNLRLSAFGGRFAGDAALQDMAEFQVNGKLSGFNLETVSRTFLDRKLGYNGTVSGPVQASGNINHMDELGAKINLAIAPVPRAPGIPVSGKLNAGYSGKGNTVTLATSYIALPHTRVDLSGELNRQINVKAVSHNLSDFQPVAGDLPVTLAPKGAVNLNATVAGNLSSPRIGANLAVTNFSAQGRPFNSLTADIAASPSNVAVTNAVIARNSLQMQLSANAGLRNWKPLPSNPLRADATIRNADVADVLALAEQTSIPATGAFTLDAHVNGTIGSPVGTVDVSANNGTIDGQKYDALTIHAEMTPNAITVPTLSLTSGAARLDANAQFQHPTNDMAQGTVTAHVAANQIQLAQFQALVKDRPGLAGSVTLNADGSATLRASQFDISSITANIAARNLAMQGQNLGDFTATANTAGTAVQYNVTSNFAGSNIRVIGQSELNGDHRTSADANISNLPIDRVLAVAGQRDLPVKGTFSATAQVSGTLQDPQATATVAIVNGSAYQESITRLEANATYNSREINVPRFHLEDGPATLDASLAFSHPVNDMEDGDVQVHVASNQIQLSRVATVRQSQPGLAGVVQLTADAAAHLRKNATPLFSTLNANLRATGVSMNRQNLGDLTASATTRGNAVAFNLASDIAKTNIKGSGTVELSSNYPVNAQITFGNVTYRGLSPLISPGTPAPLDASVEGSLNVSGPATDLNALNATLQLTKLEAHSAPATTLGGPPRINLNVENSGNIVVALNHGNVSVQNFHLAGHDADLTLSGTAAISGKQALNLHANGNLNLEILEGLSSDIYSSGTITLVANVAGTPSKPDLTGQVQLQKASFNMLDLPNGISNANGSVVFNGTDAYIRNITGESGGGKVTLTGTLGLGERMLFHTQLTAAGVRVNYPETITTQLDANVSINGSSESSLVTGTVSVTGVSLHSGADVGNVLTAAASPPSTSAGTGGLLAGMRLDVRIVTAPGAQIRTTLTQNLQAEANLTLLGTPSNPGMIGRVNVTEGDVVFFGSKYTINEGSILFSNASKINPRLNIDLETTVQGIDVSLTVSGPVDKMKLSYRSDPPLQFQQIVSLLASGSTPTTDPVLAAHTPAAPQQTLEQSGASAVLGNAVANPVSGRLQRLFGVSKLSIDPQIVGGNTAQATLTLQQQITKDLTFTYIEDVTNSNPQVIRAEWNINPRYSAVAERDVNGEVIVDLFYKKRFK